MNLDDTTAFAAIDRENMLAHIDGLPEQLEAAYRLGLSQPLPSLAGIRSIIISGMGGSAIGADLLAAYVADQCPVPVIVHRDYDLPAWASGPETLVIASSHSGDTEETLSSYQTARQRGCSLMTVSTGGKLAADAEANGIPCWRFEHHGQPRSAVGFSFGLLLAFFARQGWIADPAGEVAQTVSAMRAQQQTLGVNIPASQNPAKRMAGQFYGRWVAVFGSGVMAPVARRWKGQISEIAKAWAQFEFLPEADHNTMAGLLNPADTLAHSMMIFLRSKVDHPRNRMRSDLTRQGFMLEGLNTDFVDAQGDGTMANMWTTLHLGDYIAYYLAMAYGVDPTPVDAIQGLKAQMK